MKNTFTLLFAVVLVFVACTNSPKSTEESNPSEKEQSPVYGINGDDIPLRKGPGESFDKIINEKATEVLKETQYCSVDKSVKVIEEEVKDDWSKIKVVEPEHLSNSHFGWIQTKYIIKQSGENLNKETRIMKVVLFNNVDSLREKLSKNGIGELKSWRSDGTSGFMSITDYYKFGSVSVENGLDNNLSYYLESQSSSYVETLKIVLNVFNEDEKKQALSEFKKVTEKTFKSIGLKIPSGLLEAIVNTKDFKAYSEMFTVTLVLEKSNIESWKLTIKTK